MIRCVETFQHPPYDPLRTSKRFPAEVRQRSSDTIERAVRHCDKCGDTAFTIPLGNMAFIADDAPGVLDGPVNEFVEQIWDECPVTNLANGDAHQMCIEILPV